MSPNYATPNHPPESRRGLVASLTDAAPPGLARLDDATLRHLRTITSRLLATYPDAASEYARFQAQSLRALDLPASALQHGIADAVVLVTGGTGCIGTAVMDEISRLSPRRLVCVSRGRAHASRPQPFAEYVRGDIRDCAGITKIIGDVEPSVVFHLAAERDPGRAEANVVDSLMTNVIGTNNVLRACEASGVASFNYASTGKALRLYTPHVYAASKKLGELLTLVTARRSDRIRCSVSRFTHVVDNSLVLRRFCAVGRRDALRLHDPTTLFYTQSAREAAQLLLIANGSAQQGVGVDIVAIRDLGLPAKLLDLALGVVASFHASEAIYVCGDEPGYDDSFYPGLYDPETAADLSPLLNSLEAAHARSPEAPGIDASTIRVADPESVYELIGGLETICRADASPMRVREALNVISLKLLTATVAPAEASLLRRLAGLTSAWRSTMSNTNLIVDDCIRQAAGLAAF